MSLTKSVLAAATTLILGAAGNAWAQTCVQDRDCPQGFACTAANSVGVAEPSCPEKTLCPATPDASPPMVVMSCAPRSCNADADCGAGMVCRSETSTACSGGASAAPCPPDQPNCDAGAPVKMEEMCTTTTVKACAFKWQLPCNLDSDCGAGFTCKPSVTGSCSGSAGSGTATPADPGFAPPPTDAGAAHVPTPPMPPMCMTTTSFPGYCQPTATTCQVDSDCPAHWKCAESPETAVSGPGTGTARPTPIAPPPAGADAGAPPARSCVSEFAVPARDSKGEATMGGSGGTPNGGPTTPTPPPAATHTADAGAAPAAKSSGCAVGAGPGSSGLGLLLVAALGLLVARRRRA